MDRNNKNEKKSLLTIINCDVIVLFKLKNSFDGKSKHVNTLTESSRMVKESRG